LQGGDDFHEGEEEKVAGKAFLDPLRHEHENDGSGQFRAW
jgi:hypothetical protein